MNADSEFLVHFDIGPQFRGLAHEDWDIIFFVNFYHKGGPLPKKNLKFFFPKDMTIYTRIESPCSV